MQRRPPLGRLAFALLVVGRRCKSTRSGAVWPSVKLQRRRLHHGQMHHTTPPVSRTSRPSSTCPVLSCPVTPGVWRARA